MAPTYSLGVEPPNKFLKRGGLTGSQVLDVVAGKEGVTFFSGGCSFYIKKLNSEIFNDKKVYEQNYFSLLELRKIKLENFN